MKKLGNILISILSLLAIIVVVVACIWAADVITTFLEPITWTAHAFIAAGIIFVILSLVPNLKRHMLPPIMIVSYILGFFLFISSCFVIFNGPHSPYNYIWLIVGVLICGFGVTPIAIIICLIYSQKFEFQPLWHILAMLIAASLFRYYVAKQISSNNL